MCCACSKTDIMLHLEIQEGKGANPEINKDQKARVACCLRMGAASAWSTNKVCNGNVDQEDFWFSFVQTATAMALCSHHHIGAEKTAHSQFHKKFLMQTTQNWLTPAPPSNKRGRH